MMPTGMPISSHVMAPPTASAAVAGSRSKICERTDDVVLVAEPEVEVQHEVLHVLAVLDIPRLIEPQASC